MSSEGVGQKGPKPRGFASRHRGLLDASPKDEPYDMRVALEQHEKRSRLAITVLPLVVRRQTDSDQ